MPFEPGWKKWPMESALAGLSAIDVSLKTVAGVIRLSLRVYEGAQKEKMTVLIPRGTVSEISGPNGWELESKECAAQEMLTIERRDKEVIVRIFKIFFFGINLFTFFIAYFHICSNATSFSRT